MIARFPVISGLAMALVLTAPVPGLAGGLPAAPGQHSFVPAWIAGEVGSTSSGGETESDSSNELDNVDTETLNAQATGAIVNALNGVVAFCGALGDRDYVVDCVAAEYREVERKLPSTGEYVDAKAAIASAAGRLEVLARSNRSTTKRPARLSQGGATPNSTPRPVVPIQSDAVPAVGQAAAQILEETQTVLLRSTDNSERRRLQYQRIAEAMDSGAILLRSL